MSRSGSWLEPDETVTAVNHTAQQLIHPNAYRFLFFGSLFHVGTLTRSYISRFNVIHPASVGESQIEVRSTVR